jgi:hypothetical protein
MEVRDAGACGSDSKKMTLLSLLTILSYPHRASILIARLTADFSWKFVSSPHVVPHENLIERGQISTIIYTLLSYDT